MALRHLHNRRSGTQQIVVIPWRHHHRFDTGVPLNIMIENYRKILKEPFDLDKIKKCTRNGKGMCEFDLYILGQYIKQKKIKKIIELGCGTSTVFLKSLDNIEVFTYCQDTLERVPRSSSPPVKNHHLIRMFINESNIEEIYKNCIDADLILIDCDHSKQFTELYYHKLLKRIKIPVFIHDFFTSGNIWPEEKYLKNVLQSEKIFKIFIATNDIKDPKKIEIVNEIENLCKFEDIQMFVREPYGSDAWPPACSVILEPV